MNAFDKIIGYQGEKEELMRLCDILRNQDRYKALGTKLPRGLLIHGDPGLGKSLMARCFMEAVGWKSYTIRRNHPDGDFIRELNRVFLEAAETAPSIILLDDMDKFVVEEKSTEEYVAVQAGIDEVAEKDVYVIATVNDMKPIPASLLRAGRFDRKIHVTAPDGKDAEDIIRFYLQNKNLGSSVNFSDVARMLRGNSCAELETMLNEAAICAGYGRSKQIEMDHIVEVILRDEYGAGNDMNTQDSSIRWQIAYHEAGHAAIQELLCEGGVGLVSIRPRRNGIGGFMRTCAQSSAECADVLISLAGTAATELKYGVRDAGAAKDIRRAIKKIRDIVDRSGIYGVNLMGTALSDSGALLNQQEAVTAAEAERYLTLTRIILAQNRAFLDALSQERYEKGTLLNSDISRIRAQCAIHCPNLGVVA